ncbi:YbhB/YbcL family Raf kinase inhibitor-like protein [Ktedonobacter robiniae]|nr:YbhB/YbcL family Raf kinase inhibitor-like protein [Ktedonobacter robiniae]
MNTSAAWKQVYILFLSSILGALFIVSTSTTTFAAPSLATGKKEAPMKLTSPAFEHGQPIPSQYTCDGANHHPPLTISDVPREAQSLALVVEDPDAPMKVFTHWLIYDLPPSTQHILEQEGSLGGAEGVNDFGTRGYKGPCPPSGTHHYVFRLFALDTRLALPEGMKKEDVLAKLKGHVLATAELVGTYKRG